IPPAVSALAGAALPDQLGAAGAALRDAVDAERAGLVEAWLEGALGVEAGLATPDRDAWTGAACPACGGSAQVSVIAEESGEFMGGSPRSLVCGRCAGWWTFPRAVCAWCSESDPNRLPSFVPHGRRAVRIDGCEHCGHYVKTFDLREAA